MSLQRYINSWEERRDSEQAASNSSFSNGNQSGIEEQFALKSMQDEQLAEQIAESNRAQMLERGLDMSRSRDGLELPEEYAQTYGTAEGANYGGNNSGLSGSYWDKMSKIESNGDYNAVNKSSGAYGKWQIMPKTMKSYANKLGISMDEARTPQGQDAVIKKFTDDNARALRRAGLPVNDKTLYLAHQQGAGGAINLLKGNYDSVSDRNVNSNNPDGVSKSQFAGYWMNRMA